MQELGMHGGNFQVACESDDSLITRHGIDRIAFMVAANPGQETAPLAEAASGGELSRISLAIQVATAKFGKTPTLIFDEVDVGIGGAVAEIVGKLLRRLGEDRQVLCVTHLPQVAAQAHHHLQVRKRNAKGSTETSIRMLDPERRVEEIARMLGGVRITEQTLAHAREMLPEPG
jgi:DNA repair protein RecN (Recombination protein N)